ncbi:hypothetical protein BT93_L2171 [Corymbia citriodora subsp. variegata]|uniref:Uncharacterized protein n=1 Tax=Corymbia citriodora subsp. variegata TaxID=360336 RepID=A0A8T0CKZ7_CORYI|nr:hypothetical protein BT93_L2171 [Corymbia citriodora subsp. variegata]
MGIIRLPGSLTAKKFLSQTVMVAKKKKKERFNSSELYRGPIPYLSHPSFQGLLSRSEEEYGFDYPTIGLTIPCEEVTFSITSRFAWSKKMDIPK